MAKRKQLNIGLDPVQYVAVRAAAEGQTVTAYCRDVVLARAMPEPELPEGAALPLWLVHLPAVSHQGETPPRPVTPNVT